MTNPNSTPSESREERFCNKCGYFGPDTLHQRPNGSGECGYLSMLCKRAPQEAAPVAGAVVREFTNELGNAIRITIEGPASTSENILTPMEASKLREALNEHATPGTPEPAAVLCPNGEPWDDNPDGIVPGQERGPRISSETGFWEGAEADEEGEEDALADAAIAAGHTPGDSVPGVSTAALVRALNRCNSTSKSEPAAASGAVAKWIDDPHDIEQGQMLNPAWLKLHGLTAQEALAAPAPGGESGDAVWEAAGALTNAYLLQDTRSNVGNCPMWWAEGGKGYTSRIDKAQKYTREQALRQCRARDTDLPWAYSEIAPLQRPTIDVQDFPRSIEEQRAALRSGGNGEKSNG